MGDLSMPARLALLAFGLLGACLGGADAHGYLVSPASRNMVALGRNKYESSAGNGLGIQPFRDPGSPGVCGDPFQDASTNFVAAAHSVQATYSQGQTIDITVDVNVNHGGRFSFSVCNRNSGLDQSCFDQNKLERCVPLRRPTCSSLDLICTRMPPAHLHVVVAPGAYRSSTASQSQLHACAR